MPSEGKKAFDHLTALHDKYSRYDLRGMWQRDGGAAPQLESRLWSWKEIEPILEESLKTVRLPEDTDQRVIGLNAPGSTNRAIWLAYQLLNPGEQVASHRHTPAQMRFIVQGTGAYTTAEGERMFMEPGDLLVQPNWTWHGRCEYRRRAGALVGHTRSELGELPWRLCARPLAGQKKVQPMTRAEDYHSKFLGSFRPTQFSGSSAVQPPFRYKWGRHSKGARRSHRDGGSESLRRHLVRLCEPRDGPQYHADYERPDTTPETIRKNVASTATPA